MFNRITLSQKYILFSILLIKTAAHCADVQRLRIYCSDNEINCYTQLHLDARIQWLWDRDGSIDQLKNKAHTSPNKIFNYVTRSEHIARFDANQKEVTTFVSSGQKLTLSYEMFDRFIQDRNLCNQASERYFELINGKTIKYTGQRSCSIV
jgi:hypothetical protein